MAGIAAVGIHDDLAAREAGIALGAAHHEFAGGVHQEAGGLFRGLEAEIGGGGLHHMAPQVGGNALAQGLLLRHTIDLSGVLRGDQDGVDRHGLIVFVHHAHLGFAVRQQVAQGAVVAHFRQAARQAVSQADRQRHQLRRFIAGIAEHDSLVAGTHEIEGIAGVVIGLIHTLGDVGRLLIESHQHGAAVGIEATGAGAAVTDLLDHTPHQGVEVHPSGGGHLAGDQAQARVHHGFAGHTRGGVLGEQRIEHRIAHLITDLVGVTLGHRFRGEHVARRRPGGAAHSLSWMANSPPP